MRKGLRFGLLAVVAGCWGPVAAQAEDAPKTATVPVQVPPPIVIVPPPVPVLRAPQATAVRSGAAPVKVAYGHAPKPTPTPTAVLGKKQARAFEATKQGKATNCFIRNELKSWMAKAMLENCDWLLSQYPSDGEPWDFRARVLQFRALALINLGDNAMAIEALDESDAIGDTVGDPLFDLGVGVGNELLRAYIAGRAGEIDRARELIAHIRTERPLALSAVRAADRVEGGFDGGATALVDRLEKRVRIDPNVTRSLLFIYLMQSELDRAARVGEQVSVTDPKLRGGWTLERDEGDLEAVDRDAIFAGVKAYVARARGDSARADALLADARAIIEDYVGPDPRTDGKKVRPGKQEIARWIERSAKGEELLSLVGEWESAGKLRAELGSHTMEQMLDVVNEFKNKGDLFAAVIDLLREYSKSDDSEEAKTASTLVGDLVSKMLEQQDALVPGELGQWLPLPENLEQIPKFASTASKWLLSDGSGYSQAKEGDGRIRTVRYESEVGAPAMVEEMLLMAVANYAEKEGCDAFMILSRRTIQRTITTSGTWIATTTRDAGYEAQARVLLVNTAAPPPSVAGQDYRLITVKEVQEQIAPRYTGYVERKEAAKLAAKAAKKKG
ncbi:MAG: hypothetical protein H6R45_752 [Proteobacteria bacterium]|nr:hypothetical protein [Pseudomonadota bacterium]